jgi:Ca2+-binding EF-hand superfamily protein
MAPPAPVNFTEAEKAEFMAIFKQFDADGNGHIDAKEVRDVLVSIGEKDVPGFRVRELIEEVDTNKNGTIEFDEFLYVSFLIPFPF